MATKRTTAPAVPAEDPPADGQPEPVEIVDLGGWFRNTTPGEITLIDPPSVVVAPDQVVWRDRTPSHYGLVLTSAPEPAAEPVPEADATPATDAATPSVTPAEEPTP